MVKVEDFQNYSKEQVDAAVQSMSSLTKSVQAIAAAMSDYSKKAFEDNSAFVEKLAGVRSFDKAIELQTEFGKASYEKFVAEATKIGEMYADLAKECYKPVESYMTKLGAVR